MLPTIIITSLIGIAFAAVVIHEIVKKKNGKGGCSCGCGGCSLKDICHNKK
ncbi:MAG: FeoB-associated Cys-rich membrane protein [Clostridia bacterium]|nr:FeoB-associated Cys-rich membrane protein [Clostridia bacterium]